MGTKLGFDIGNSSVKIAAVSGGKITVHQIRMPDNMMTDGEIAMPNGFSDFLRREMKARKIKGRECALVFPARQAICRFLAMPRMTKEQLALNLPYEFSEFVENDPDKFVYDYAMCAPDESDDEEQMYMMAAAASKDRITQYIRIFSGAGLKLKTLLPVEMSLMRLVAGYRGRDPENRPHEYCFVNLGRNAMVITIIKNDRIRAARQIEMGCNIIDDAIADMMGVDPFLAGTYKYNNFQGVLDTPQCAEAYQRLAVEIQRVLNFYRFNYRDSELSGIYLLGGGAAIRQLTDVVEEMTEMPALPLNELMNAPGLDQASAVQGALAIGMAIG